MLDASKTVAEAIRSRRPAVGQNFAAALEACWPLHPAMAALLGPISKRQFGQNERSTFGFLSSVEPHGFRTYLNSTLVSEASWYRPSDYWDYLRSNLEPAILASPDGHRWSQAVEAVERAEAKTGDALLVSLIKNIAVIDLFRNGSGLAADIAVIGALFYDKTREELDARTAKARNPQGSTLQELHRRLVGLRRQRLRHRCGHRPRPWPLRLASTMHGWRSSWACTRGGQAALSRDRLHALDGAFFMQHRAGREDRHRLPPKKGEFGTFILALAR